MKLDRLVAPFELKALLSDTRVFEGYASIFGVADHDDEVIAKGAFKATLREWKAKGKLPKLLLQHGFGFFGGGAVDMVPIGKWEEMREDDTGLFARGRLFDVETDRVKAVYAAMKEGELDGLSIGFRMRKFKIDQQTGIRTLTDIELWETSIVTFPANNAARISAVKSDGELPTERDFERWLRREAGFSERQSETIIAKGYRQLKRGGSVPAHEACEQFAAACRSAAATLTGVQQHGTDVSGS